MWGKIDVCLQLKEQSPCVFEHTSSGPRVGGVGFFLRPMLCVRAFIPFALDLSRYKEVRHKEGLQRRGCVGERSDEVDDCFNCCQPDVGDLALAGNVSWQCR